MKIYEYLWYLTGVALCNWKFVLCEVRADAEEIVDDRDMKIEHDGLFSLSQQWLLQMPFRVSDTSFFGVEKGGNTFLRNVDKSLPGYTVWRQSLEDMSFKNLTTRECFVPVLEILPD